MSRIALTVALALAVTLTGCSGVTVGPSHTYYGPVVETTAPPAAPVVGDPIDHDTAIAIRKERADDGSFAYQLPDKTWVYVNVNEPLPAVVMEVEQAKADALELPAGRGVSDVLGAAGNAKNFTSAYNYNTGRKAVVVFHGLRGSGTGAGNIPSWMIMGDVANDLPQGGNGWDTPEAATAAAQALINGRDDAHLYDIIVSR